MSFIAAKVKRETNFLAKFMSIMCQINYARSLRKMELYKELRSEKKFCKGFYIFQQWKNLSPHTNGLVASSPVTLGSEITNYAKGTIFTHGS